MVVVNTFMQYFTSVHVFQEILSNFKNVFFERKLFMPQKVLSFQGIILF